MKIGVMSDSHDHIWHMAKAVQQANRLGVERIIHCGDLISPFMLEELDAFSGTLHLIFGNNPGDQTLLMEQCRKRQERVHHHGWFGEMEDEDTGRRIAWIHAPHLAWSICRSGDFDLVCCGHTHRWRLDRVGTALLLNPGEILGKKEAAGWALLDTQTMEIEHILLD